jgi:hypothetical protein
MEERSADGKRTATRHDQWTPVGILTDALREGPPKLAAAIGQALTHLLRREMGGLGRSLRPPSLDGLRRHGARNYRMAGAFLPSRGGELLRSGGCFLLHRQSSRINAPHHFHQPELQRRGGWATADAEPDPSIIASFPLDGLCRSWAQQATAIHSPSSRLNTACGCWYRRQCRIPDDTHDMWDGSTQHQSRRSGAFARGLAAADSGRPPNQLTGWPSQLQRARSSSNESAAGQPGLVTLSARQRWHLSSVPVFLRLGI